MATQQQKVPVLRFPEFSGVWTENQLGAIGTIKTGPFGSLLHEKDYVDKGTPIITVEHLGELGIKHKNFPLVSAKDKERLKGYILKVDDIVFSRVGSVDRNSIIKPKEDGWLFSGRLLRIRTESRHAHAKFLSFSFQQVHTKYKIRSVAVGQTMPSLNTKIISFFCVFFPSSILEQQKIASFLSSVDTKIELLGKKKALLEQYKKGMMQKLFSQEIRFKDEQGNDYSDWGERRFDEIANIIMGTSPKSSAYNHSMNGLPLIQGNADVKNRKSAPRIYTSEITKECLPNDTLLSVRAPVGEVSRAIHHACIGRGMSAVRVKAISEQDYIFHYLVWYEPRWKGLSQGSTFESVNTKSIESLKIFVPSKLEQQKIADFLSAIDKKIDLVAEQLEQARTFKKGLLQQMFI